LYEQDFFLRQSASISNMTAPAHVDKYFQV